MVESKGGSMQQGEKNERQLRSFSELCGCGCMQTDEALHVETAVCACSFTCPAKHGIDASAEDEGCEWAHRRAAYGADKFGGKYIYFCPAGFVFCIAEVKTRQKKGYLFAGPLNISEEGDFVPGDSSHEIDLTRIDSDAFSLYRKTVPMVSTERVSAIADLLEALAVSRSENPSDMRDNEEKALLQQQIGDYVQGIKSRILLGVEQYAPYPYEKERLLVEAIRSGDEKEAKRYLNEILGHIFFASANNMDAIKLRAFELLVILSREASVGGEEDVGISPLGAKFVSDFFKLENIDDICFALTKFLNQFSADTFIPDKAKHKAIIQQVVSFLRGNYMHKITLSDAAAYVYLSPSYLSRIFKEEMQTSFNLYLNELRVEKSKILLHSKELSMIEVAELVGFVDQSYFNKIFKKQTGMTPKRYREAFLIR